MKDKVLIMAVTLGCMILTTGCTGKEESSSSPAESSTKITSDLAENNSGEGTITPTGAVTTVKSTATTAVSTSTERGTETTAVTTQSPVSSENAKKLYKDCFLNHYDTSSDLVCLKDVTHDGIDDMIVICHDAEDIVYSGIIYTIIDSSVTKIYEKQGTLQHIGNFFNWYLVENNGIWNLAEEYFKMWQGTGETGFREYYLTNSGDEIEQNLIYVESPDDDEFSGYIKQLDKAIENSYRIFYCYSESSATPKQIETNPKIVFDLSDNVNTEPDKTETTVQTTTKIPETTTEPPKTSPIETTTTFPITTRPPETTTTIIVETEPSHTVVEIDAPGRTIQGCNVRSTPSKDSDDNIIDFLPEGAGFTVDSFVDDYWYHITYWGGPEYTTHKSGYVSKKVVELGKTLEVVTIDGVEYTVPMLRGIAENLYIENAFAVVSCYTYDIVDYDYSDALSPDDFYFRVTNADSKNDVLNIIHQKFSAKYDDYNRGETSGDPRENDACAVSSCIENV